MNDLYIKQLEQCCALLDDIAEEGCRIVYNSDADEIGEYSCCGELSFYPHADDCWYEKTKVVLKEIEQTLKEVA